MEYRPVKQKLPDSELPANFAYPEGFNNFLQNLPAEDALEPWGFTADTEANRWLSEKFNLPLVQFAQAWHEDMIACFVAGPADESKIIVLNPWAQSCVNGSWEETGEILEEISSFDLWLEWVRNSELFRLYAEHRAEREQPRDNGSARK